jgi:hypothetical protein
MSTEPPCRALGEYISELMTRLAASDPPALARLRHVIGSRRARITVDHETIEVEWAGPLLSVSGSGDRRLDGVGKTDRQCVLELLEGELEVYDAILDGRLEVRGDIDSIQRMFLAIEILLDAAARSPALQALANDYRSDPCLPARRPPPPCGPDRGPPGPRSAASDPERDMLSRLGLLP